MKAKIKLTKLWSILLAVVLVISMIPTVALATESATEKADFSTDPSAALSLLNAAKTGTEDSTWDPDTNTLTLNGVNFITTASTAVKLPAGSEIVLNGDNIITSGEAMSQDSFGIYASGDLTIKGAGKLTVSSDTANDDSEGIYAEKGLSISGNADVIAISGTANDDCYGIHAGDSIAISGTAKVTATGGTATDDSHGIYAKGSIAISGGTLTANGGKATDESYGIYTKGNITITDGTVTANGGEAGESYGIYASGSDEDYIGVKISGGATVTATGGEATNGDSYGINAYHKVNIAGGTVNANGGTATNNSFGIYADDDVNISGGTVNANGGTATNNSFGIYAHYKVNIAGGTLIAKVTSGNGTANALNKAPKTLPDTYWWRTSTSGDYTKSTGSAYTWAAGETYVEIRDTEPAATTYTVFFDANGGSGTMTAATGVLGDYTLPENSFTAPEGKQFKCWSVDGTEKAVGDKITVAADTTVKAVWENIPATPTPTEYEILDGANGSWTQNSDGSLSFRGNGAFSEFVGVKVDGNLVDAKNYTVKEGSTIVTLNADYLNTLTAGNHTLEIVWTDGSASTAFTVNAKAVVDNNTKSPQTGDNSVMGLWLAVFVSAFGIMFIVVCRKKRESATE